MALTFLPHSVMCGRYASYSPIDQIARLLQAEPAVQLDPRYNIAPGQQVLAARLNTAGARELVGLHWGLIPVWAKDRKTGYSLINARAETVAEKPTFRHAFKQRRCLIAADGFYEWRKADEGPKQPYFIRLKTREPFAFAGLWEHWEDKWAEKGGGEAQTIDSCAIIVTRANSLVKQIHDRMPVILSPADYDRWLDPDTHEPERLLPLLVPFGAEQMETYRIGTAINNPRNEGQQLLEQAAG